MLVDPFTDTAPDSEQLRRALDECGVAADQIPQTVDRLTRPPLLFGLSALQDPEVLSDRRGFDSDTDGDMAAWLLSLHEGRPDDGATWKALSYPARKRAERLWESFGKHHGLCSTPKGHPPKLDAALVLYCTRVLAEASGKDRFKFSSSTDGSKQDGPMWRALTEALPIAQRFLARRYRTPVDATAASIVDIVTLARSKEFADWSQKLGLGFGSHDVAGAPAQFRAAIMFARKEQRPDRGSRPRKRRA